MLFEIQKKTKKSCLITKKVDNLGVFISKLVLWATLFLVTFYFSRKFILEFSFDTMKMLFFVTFSSLNFFSGPRLIRYSNPYAFTLLLFAGASHHRSWCRCAHRSTFNLSAAFPSRKAHLFPPKGEPTFCATLVGEMAVGLLFDENNPAF